MSKAKQLWLLAGGNGAGKTTFYRTQLQPLGMPFVNADVLAKELFPEEMEQRSYEAAKIAEQIRLQLLKDGRTFCFETVFSHPSKIDFAAQAKALGYEVILVFVHLENTDLNNARVSQRVEEGGHFVPSNKVSERVPRTLKHIKLALALCDRAYILDNSRFENPFSHVAELRGRELVVKRQPLPDWAATLLEDYMNQ